MFVGSNLAYGMNFVLSHPVFFYAGFGVVTWASDHFGFMFVN